MRKVLRLSIPLSLVAVLALAGCARAGGAYPGLGTPRAALETYFASAKKADYVTTYDCYYQHYKDLVQQQDYVGHRAQEPALKSYAIGAVSTTGDSAEASVTLAFASPKGAASGPSSVVVHEDLVKEKGSWRIKVW